MEKETLRDMFPCDRGIMFIYIHNGIPTTTRHCMNHLHTASTKTPQSLPSMHKPVTRKYLIDRGLPVPRVYLNKFCCHRQDMEDEGPKGKKKKKNHNSHFAHSTALIVGMGEPVLGAFCLLPTLTRLHSAVILISCWLFPPAPSRCMKARVSE